MKLNQIFTGLNRRVTKNSIYTIFPYKEGGQWVFDDESVGLHKEAFVAGADTLLDVLTGDGDRCTVVFSESSFPDHQLELTLKHTDETGSVYFSHKHQHELWLCPALFLYYSEAPKKIFLKVKLPKDGNSKKSSQKTSNKGCGCG